MDDAEATGIRGLFDVLIVDWNHLLHARVARRSRQQVGQAFFDDFEDDVDGDGGSGRGSQQGGEGAILVGQNFGAKIDGTTVGLLEGLNANARIDQSPVALEGLRIKFLKACDPIRHTLESLGDKVMHEAEVSNSGF